MESDEDGSDVNSSGVSSVENGGLDPPRLSTQERLRLAKRRRAEQLKRWAQREREWKKAGAANGTAFMSNGNKRHVAFESSIVLLEAAARNDLEEVRRLLDMGVSPDSTNEDGLTALHQCCIDDSEEMMKILVEYGGNPNATDTEKWTPLHAAATCGHLHLVKFLIDAGADLLGVNADGNMPYDLCEDETTLSYIENEMARRGVTQEIIDDTRSETERRMLHDLQILQMDGGDLDFKESGTNATPLHIASANGYLSVVEFLLEHHVSTDVEDEDLWQPIHAAACWGHLEIVEVLAQNGANINARTRNGETPFDICEDPDIKERLMQLKEQRLLSEQPRVRRSRSTSTRTQSIRRTSLREKMNTTKRDVQDEKLHFMQTFDHEKRKPQQQLRNTLSPDDAEVVDIHDVELTLLPSYVDADPQQRQHQERTSPPQRPPRNHDSPNVGEDKSGQFVNRVVLSGSEGHSPNARVSVRVNDSSPKSFSPPRQKPPAPQPTNSQPRGAVQSQSQTLSDLKKQRSMSRVKHPSPQQPPRPTAYDIQTKNNGKAKSSSSRNNAQFDEDDSKKFQSTNSEVVGPPHKKPSCCKIL